MLNRKLLTALAVTGLQLCLGSVVSAQSVGSLNNSPASRTTNCVVEVYHVMAPAGTLIPVAGCEGFSGVDPVNYEFKGTVAPANGKTWEPRACYIDYQVGLIEKVGRGASGYASAAVRRQEKACVVAVEASGTIEKAPSGAAYLAAAQWACVDAVSIATDCVIQGTLSIGTK